MIGLDVSIKGLSSAIRRVDTLIKKLNRLEKELPEALARYGEIQAQAKYDTAAYNIMLFDAQGNLDGGGGHPNIHVHAERENDGWAVYADGVEVCFVEFGAGVYYNGDGGNYLGTRPPGVVGIGEYGKGHGKNPQWGLPAEAGGGVTRGTPASNALYFTAQDMKEKIEEEVRRILND